MSSVWQLTVPVSAELAVGLSCQQLAVSIVYYKVNCTSGYFRQSGDYGYPHATQRCGPEKLGSDLRQADKRRGTRCFARNLEQLCNIS